MDSYISRTVRDIGQISKLMGVTTVICGLDPNVAMTLIEMGMDLEGVEPHLHMEAAFEALQRHAEERRAEIGAVEWLS